MIKIDDETLRQIRILIIAVQKTAAPAIRELADELAERIAAAEAECQGTR